MAAPRTIALSQREPASAGTSRGSRRAQDSAKRSDLLYVVYGYSIVVKKGKGKGKAIPLQPWRGPEGSRMFSLSDFKTVGT